MTERFTDAELAYALRRAAGSVSVPERLQRPSALVVAAGERYLARGRRAVAMTLMGAGLAVVASVGLAVGGPGALDWLRGGFSAAAPESVRPEAGESMQVVITPPRLALSYPVQEAVLSSPYGERNLFEKKIIHQGVDFAAAVGTPVLAAADGTVLSAGRGQEGYGLLVALSHGQVNGAEVVTWYGHLHEMAVEVGQQVRRGEPVGSVGTTGGATGPYLHFEVRVNDRPVDPLPWFGQ